MADRVVGQGSQADDCVVAGAVPRLDIPEVEPRAGTGVLWSRTEVATLVESEVETIDGVSGRAQERDQNRSDVATITCDEDLHCYPYDRLEVG